jgi:hypothetical protein
MRRPLLLLGCAVALCAPSSMAAGVPVAKRCDGSVKVGSIVAGSIRTTKVSCTKGKSVIRGLLCPPQSETSMPDNTDYVNR